MRFNSFQTEVQKVAGFHTGRALNVGDDHLEDNSVRLHEQIHNRLFTETQDGYLHLNVLGLIDRTDDAIVKVRLQKINRRLFRETLLAHERVATFLGVQALPTSAEMAEARAALPRQYKEYYSYFDVIMRDMKSSFVAFDVAWAFAAVSFGSPRIAEVDDLESLLSGASFLVPGPTERLNKIRDGVLSTGHDEFLRAINASFKEVFEVDGQEAFDITDDEQWKARAATQSGQMTDRLFIEKMEMLAASLLGSERSKRFKIPACFEGSTLSIPPFRHFEHDFPFENGRQKYTQEAVKHYAREVDFHRIHRPEAGTGIAIYDEQALLKIFIDWLEKLSRPRIHVSIVEEQGNEPCFFIYVLATLDANSVRLPPLVLDKSKLNFFLLAIYNIYKDLDEKPTLYFVSNARLGEGGSSSIIPDGLINVIPDAACRTLRLTAPHSGLGLSFFIYSRDIWSGILAKQSGMLEVFSVGFQVEESQTVRNLCFCIVYPNDETFHPYVALMTVWSYQSYDRLMQQRKQDGELQIVTGSDLSPEAEAMLVAIWQTFRQI